MVAHARLWAHWLSMARLKRADCSGPGLTRRRRGKGFEYLDEDGHRISDPEVLDRIGELTIPPAWQKVWAELLAAADKVTIDTAWEWPSAEQFRTADVMVFYQRGDWTPERAREIDPFLARGGGLVYLHYAVDGQKDPAGFAKRIGLSWGPGARFCHGPTLPYSPSTLTGDQPFSSKSTCCQPFAAVFDAFQVPSLVRSCLRCLLSV